MSKFYSGTIQKGSKGDETKKWQEYLNTQGYGLSVDGDFGQKTYDATIDYQNKNGLTADGIVGELTWGKAGYSNINNPVKAPESKAFEYDDFKYDDYTESDSVKQAGTNKTNAENALANYGDFSYSKDATFNAIMDKILNREKFSYDLNGDALYQQYKDKYIQQGKMAMQDTMGQAAAMTGGYGNSYASTAGNQAYQASLENLNDIIPELYQMAYDKYNQEGQDMLNQYGMLSDDRNREYGEWSDGYNRAVADRDYYANAYDSERSYDYNKYADNRNFDYGVYSDDRNLAYNTHRNEIADAQWNATFNEGIRQYELNLAEQKRQYDTNLAESQRQHDNNTNTQRQNNNKKNDTDDKGFSYITNEATTNWKNLLPTQAEFNRYSGGYEYNGVKYKNWESFIDAKLSDAMDNGDLTEDEAVSIMIDLGLA
jgi:hypothetical protein